MFSARKIILFPVRFFLVVVDRRRRFKTYFFFVDSTNINCTKNYAKTSHFFEVAPNLFGQVLSSFPSRLHWKQLGKKPTPINFWQ